MIPFKFHKIHSKNNIYSIFVYTYVHDKYEVLFTAALFRHAAASAPPVKHSHVSEECEANMSGHRPPKFHSPHPLIKIY